MYIVLEGAVDLGSHRPNRVGPGGCFAEAALVKGPARPVDAAAVGRTRLPVLNDRSLESLRRFSPRLASRLTINLARILPGREARG